MTVLFSTITTMPPTLSADSSVGSALSQGSGLSFDAGAFNLGNKGVKMDAHKLFKPYAYIDEDCCRASFTLVGSKDPLVCGLFLTQCTRPGHKILRGPAKSRALAGYYRLASKKGHLADGIDGAYLSEEDYAAWFGSNEEAKDYYGLYMGAEARKKAAVIDQECQEPSPSREE